MNGLAPEYLERLFAQCYADYNQKQLWGKTSRDLII